MKYIDPIKSEDPERFDLHGLVLAGPDGRHRLRPSVAGLGLLPGLLSPASLRSARSQ